jgi:ppGpp synthetase/RelA/SpoT-type nucleotidyltranferase
MDLIDSFIARYRKEYDFYDQAARIVAQSLDLSLQTAGIRSMVTARAKSVARLEAKVRKRAMDKKYDALEDIYDDLVDLAGVRVALYFPGERDQVDTVVKNSFTVLGSPKIFPSEAKPSYSKRFSGYWATHYRVQLRDVSLSEAQKRYAEARVEIQVASVVMHAWAEVEHDLVYKPLAGELSQDEYAILDELNGLVMAGEIALERLQRAGEARVAATGRKFSNHYDLAAHLVDRAGSILRNPIAETSLGRVDLLFDLLARLGMASPEGLAPYISALHADTERRPIAEQIVDQLLAENAQRYTTYEEVRRAKETSLGRTVSAEAPVSPESHAAIGHFLSEWIKLERHLRRAMQVTGDRDRRVFMPTGKMLEQMGMLDPETRWEIDRIRRVRNNLVHGIEVPDPADIREAANRLHQILKSISTKKKSGDARKKRLQTPRTRKSKKRSKR